MTVATKSTLIVIPNKGLTTTVTIEKGETIHKHYSPNNNKIQDCIVTNEELHKMKNDKVLNQVYEAILSYHWEMRDGNYVYNENLCNICHSYSPNCNLVYPNSEILLVVSNRKIYEGEAITLDYRRFMADISRTFIHSVEGLPPIFSEKS
jgi:hypothetical protein